MKGGYQKEDIRRRISEEWRRKNGGISAG